MEVKVHKSLDAKKHMIAKKMRKTFDSGRASHIKDKHGFVKNATGYSANQSFR
jgi:hypothetical protein